MLLMKNAKIIGESTPILCIIIQKQRSMLHYGGMTINKKKD